MSVTKELLKNAVRELSSSQRRVGAKGSRFHHEASQDNMNRLRAIEDGGICACCAHLSVEIIDRSPRSIVVLRCGMLNSPVSIYRNTPLGKKAECKDFKKVE